MPTGKPKQHVAQSQERAKLLRQNPPAEFQQLKWARSATKHRISRKRIRHVIANCALAFEEDPPADHPTATDKRLVFLGEDADGVALEVIAVESGRGSVMVIHAMELRPRFRKDYEEVRR